MARAISVHAYRSRLLQAYGLQVRYIGVLDVHLVDGRDMVDRDWPVGCSDPYVYMRLQGEGVFAVSAFVCLF